MDNISVAENANDALIGNISIVDPDASDTHSFDISDDRFEIVDGKLQLKPCIALDHEEAAQIEVTITDAGGTTLTERFIVDVQDMNEGPTDLVLDNTSENLIQNGSFEEFDLGNGNGRVLARMKAGPGKTRMDWKFGIIKAVRKRPIAISCLRWIMVAASTVFPRSSRQRRSAL
ncbi:hypothetical protein [Ruegeria sp. AU67]|uniref:hypothetical protein n=1 Tax=Ruegeria sp. AU67 TaxID=2108530 RepID=UPI000D6869A8|nr:hypothetical protein [Ruegeria sp. AU67]